METFWNTIASYNAATWPAQLALTLAAVVLTLLLYRQRLSDDMGKTNGRVVHEDQNLLAQQLTVSIPYKRRCGRSAFRTTGTSSRLPVQALKKSRPLFPRQTLPGAAGAIRFPSCRTPSTYSSRTPCSAPSGFSTVMQYCAPRKRRVSVRCVHSGGTHGSIRSRVRSKANTVSATSNGKKKK